MYTENDDDDDEKDDNDGEVEGGKIMLWHKDDLKISLNLFLLLLSFHFNSCTKIIISGSEFIFIYYIIYITFYFFIIIIIIIIMEDNI